MRPSYDGQAGATAITLESSSDEQFMRDLYHALKKIGLPAYAMPRLVRISPEYASPEQLK